jgi:hypothetical protein
MGLGAIRLGLLCMQVWVQVGEGEASDNKICEYKHTIGGSYVSWGLKPRSCDASPREDATRAAHVQRQKIVDNR